MSEEVWYSQTTAKTSVRNAIMTDTSRDMIIMTRNEAPPSLSAWRRYLEQFLLRRRTLPCSQVSWTRFIGTLARSPILLFRYIYISIPGYLGYSMNRFRIFPFLQEPSTKRLQPRYRHFVYHICKFKACPQRGQPLSDVVVLRPEGQSGQRVERHLPKRLRTSNQ